MADVHNNRATVTLGGREITLVASKLAERIYGDRFRSDVDALGESNSYSTMRVPSFDANGKPELDEAGNAVTHEVVTQVAYKGALKYDVAVSAASQIGATAEIPVQVVAAAWAMAVAADSTELSFDEWLVWWWSLPSNAQDDLSLFEAVCVDLAERAFFRNYGRPNGALKPDESEEGHGDKPDV